MGQRGIRVRFVDGFRGPGPVRVGSQTPLAQGFFFFGREKGDGQGVALSLAGVRCRQTGRRRGDLVFVAQVNAADAGVVGVDGRQQVPLQKAS